MSQSLEHHSNDNQNAIKGSEVFVGGLAHTVTEDKICEVFSTCGEIIDTRLIKDQKGILKGFGFVRFATKEAADRAVKDLSGLTLEGKKIGVLPSIAQDTLFLGNLNKGWTADDFEKYVHQVFPDVVSIDLGKPLSGGDIPLGKKFHNRGFAFVKFSSHAAASRAYRAASSPEFVIGGNQHPSVEWAAEEAEIDPKELAKIKIAFIRNLPGSADENYLMKFFVPFGKVDRVVVSKKGQSSVGFIHFSQRSYLDRAIKELNGKTVHGPNGGPSFKLQVEVARPAEKKKKRAREDPHSKQPNEILSQSKLLKSEELVADSYESAVLLLPLAVKERLLRILRLGIATRYDIDIWCLTSLKELPESSAIYVLDQFMLSGAEAHDKGAYLAGLISRYQADKLGLSRLPLSSSGAGELVRKEPKLSSFSGRVHHPAYDTTLARSDGYVSRYSSLYTDYPLPSQAAFGRVDEISPLHLQQIPISSTAPYSGVGLTSHLPVAYGKTEERSLPLPPLHQIPASSTLYGNIGADSHLPGSADLQPTRTQLRFDPFTGQPFKFDPFTGEPILPDNAPAQAQSYGNPY